MDATREAVELRVLATKHPDAFLPDLATSLNNLARRLTETGDHDPQTPHPTRQRRFVATTNYILLDSRAGLHDLAGLSLHNLAHVDVLVGRDSDQSITRPRGR